MSETIGVPAARIDAGVARSAFDAAIESHAQQPERFFLARLLGLEFSYEPGRCVVAFEARDFMFNPRGTVHGGVLCLALDASMGHLMLHEGAGGVTLELKTQFVRAAATGPLRCEASVIRRTRHVWFMDSRCTDSAGELVAVATSTWAARSSEIQ